MNDTIITIRINSKLKKDAQKAAKELGFTLSAIINAYLIDFVKNKTVYFSNKFDSNTTKTEPK